MFRYPRFVAAVGLLFLLAVCSESDSPTGNGSGNKSVSNPMILEALMRAFGIPAIEGLIDAIDRSVVAIGGGTADGVVINGNRVTVDSDFAGDDSRESTLNATVNGDLSQGANYVVNSIDTPGIHSLNAGVAATVTENSSTSLSITGFSGSVYSDEPGSGNAADVMFTGGDVDIDRATGNPDGEVMTQISGEEESIDVTTTFEPDGQGGWRIRVTGPGIDFTVP